jgi:hypothetical protein
LENFILDAIDVGVSGEAGKVRIEALPQGLQGRGFERARCATVVGVAGKCDPIVEGLGIEVGRIDKAGEQHAREERELKQAPSFLWNEFG